MIKITALNKFYKSKRRSICHALKNINLTLPDAGLVFVLGKSGSGKSTLLNLIGGLDNISSGSIEVDGNDLANFKEKDFCNYRNTHIGFIFQDYHLIDELTVYENIVLSLNLRRIEDKDLVSAALAKVDLAGYENRYPTELSGGEQQRVAIARAIVKNPRIILADEPTGNLDTHTSTAIITLLKELAKECLILIVSHNVNDANNYADRIIELAKGEIISDKSRNPEFSDHIKLDGDTLIYPDGEGLSDSDIALINNRWGKNTLLIKRSDKFVDTNGECSKGAKHTIENKSLSIGREFNLSGKFLKNKAFPIILSSFMVAVIMVIMALAQTIIAFNAGQVIAGEMQKIDQDSMLFVKKLDTEDQNRLDSAYITPINKNDIDAVYSSGYSGTVYPVINFSIPISRNYISAGLPFYPLSGTLYLKESLGTIVVDEDFLARKFGENYEFVASRDRFDPRGVMITDYVADLILSQNGAFKNKGYEDIIKGGVYLSGYYIDTVIVNAIIKTNYREEYKDLFDRISAGELAMDSFLSEDSGAIEFMNDIYDRLGYCFTTNQSFLEDIIDWDSTVFATTHVITSNGKLTWSNYVGAVRRVTENGSKRLVDNKWPNWRYTTTAPEIPEGAKYMRVTHYPYAEAYYQEEDLKYAKGYATLVFNGGEPVSAEKMNFQANTALTTLGAEYSNQAARYLSDYIEIPDNAVITDFSAAAMDTLSYCTFYDENKCVISCEIVSAYTMPPRSICLTYDAYNNMFGTNYSANNVEEFVPHTAKFSQFLRSDVDQENPLIDETVIILGIGNAILASDDLFEKFKQNSFFTYALYLDGIDNFGGALDYLGDGYSNQSAIVDGIHTMTRAVEVFIPIFELVAIFLCIGIIFILINFTSKMINDKMHEIGILKALGTKNRSIVTVFGLQVVLIVILTCIMATVGYYFFIDLANDVLIDSLKRLAPARVVLDLAFLTFIPKIAGENCILVCLLSAISLIFPMIKIKTIKPVKIIKAKE